jgi:hypothetical protein
MYAITTRCVHGAGQIEHIKIPTLYLQILKLLHAFVKLSFDTNVGQFLIPKPDVDRHGDNLCTIYRI